MNSLRVGFFVERFPIRSETFVLRQARGLLEAGHDVQIVSFHPGDEWQSDSDRLSFTGRVHLIPVSVKTSLFRNIGILVLDAIRSSRGFRRAKLFARAIALGDLSYAKHIVVTAGFQLGVFDAVLAHFGHVGVRALRSRDAELFKGPIGTVFHAYEITRKDMVVAYRAAYDDLFRRGEIMFPISYLWRDKLVAWGCPASKTQVLRMGVDRDELDRRSRKIAALSSPLRVVTVGRLVEKKGTRFAIEAVLRSEVAIELRIIGTGPLESELRSLAKGSESVIFLGALDHDEVLEEVSNADVFLLPSVTAADGDMEGIPVALMEAMALGTLVIATRHSGNSELVDDGVSGWLVPERDPAKIAEVFKRLHSQELDLTTIRRAAKEKIRGEFDDRVLNVALVQNLEKLSQQQFSGLYNNSF